MTTQRRFIMKKYLLLLAVLFFAGTLAAQNGGDFDETEDEIEENDTPQPRVVLNRYRLGDGLRMTTRGGNLFIVSGMVQTTFDVRKFEGVNGTYDRFRIRRARLRFDGRIANDKLRYRLGLDLVKGSETDDSDGSMLMDAWVAYRPWGGKLVITAGQFSAPTDNRELMMSSHTLQFVERSKLTSMFGTIREVGVSVEGSFRTGREGVLRPVIAVTDGDGPLSSGKRYGGLKYGARVNWLPFGTFRSMGDSFQGDMAYELVPKLSLGAAYSYNDGTSDRRGGRSGGDILYLNDAGKTDLPDHAKFVADILFKYRGFSLLGEYVKTWAYVPTSITQRVRNDGSTSDSFDMDGEQNVEAYIKNRMMLGAGFNVQAGYMFRSLWSVDLRYTHVMPDAVSYLNNNLYFNRRDYYDLGISKYLTRSYAAKIQLNLGMARSNGENRTPDSARTYDGFEFSGTLMFQLKF